MVGSIRIEEAKADHSEGQIKVLVSHAQIRFESAKEYKGGHRDRQRKREYVVDGCGVTGNGKCSNCQGIFKLLDILFST